MESMHKTVKQRIKAAHVLLVWHSIEAYICRFVGSTIQQTFEEFRFDYSFLSFTQRAATLQIRLNYNIVNAQPSWVLTHTCM